MILLDTHIWHWWVNQIDGKLSTATIALIEDADEVGVSAISCFELSWLVRHGRIDLGSSYEEWFHEVRQANLVSFIAVTPEVAAAAVALPEHHRDPQDRMIIATTLLHGARLVSFDTAFPLYQELGARLISRNL